MRSLRRRVGRLEDLLRPSPADQDQLLRKAALQLTPEEIDVLEQALLRVEEEEGCTSDYVRWELFNERELEVYVHLMKLVDHLEKGGDFAEEH